MGIRRVLFDHDERILLNRVIGAVVEDDLGHAFRSGLNNVTFFKRKAVIRLYPVVAICLFDAYRAIECSDVRLLRDYSPGRRRLRGHPLEQIREQTADRFLSSGAELGKSKL